MAEVRIDNIFKDIVETIREPLLVLDSDLKVILASRSFYGIFKVKPEETIGQLIYDLGNKQWDIPKLRELLENILPEKTTFDNYEVEHDFSTIGKRIMLLNARQIVQGLGKELIILLAIEDITERKKAEELLQKAYDELELKVEERTRKLHNELQERKKAEESLRESEKKYRMIAENMAGTITTMDMNLRFTYVSPSIIRLHGFTVEEALEHTIDQIMTPDSFQLIAKVFEEELRLEATATADLDRTRILELEEYRKDGSTIWVENTLSFIRDKDQNPIGILVMSRDISERRQAEDALRESEKKFRQIYNNILDVYYEASLDGVILEISPSINKHSQYKREELIGKSLYDIYANPADRDKLIEIIINNGSVSDYETIITDKDGTHHIASMNIELIKDNKNNPIKLVGIFRDITERKKVDAALRESEEKFRAVFRTSPHVITLTSIEDGTYFDINDAFTKLLGYTPDEIIGESSLEFNIWNEPKDRDLSVVGLKKNGIVENIEADFKGKNGQIINGIMSARILDIEDKRYLLAVTQDITERKQAEKALTKQKKIMAEAETLADIGSWEWDIINDTWLFSDNWFNIHGCVNSQLSSSQLIQIAHHEDRPAIEEAFTRAVKNGEPYDIQHRIIRQDTGEIRYVNVKGVVEFDDSSKQKTLVGVVQDITENKKLQSQLQQAQKMESLGTLTGGIAHDFNNLLYMIVGNTELALEDIPKWNPAYTNLEEIKSASLRAAGIVKHLLNFSRKTDQKMIPIDVVTVIKDSLKFLRSTIPTNVKIHEHIPDDEIIILADSTQIDQVMMNLCINASQAMEETGGTLKIKIEKTICEAEDVKEFSDLLPGNYLKITFNDTGPGISPEIINRIFDPYFTTKDMGKGSGMGLSIVHGIIKNHSGAIWVNNSLGKGTTFTLLFPMVEEKPVNETETIDKIPRGNETILFVDDEESITNMAGQMLKRLGYRVETSLNPIDALDLFQSKPEYFDLVVTDMTMPQMTGAKLVQKLKELQPDIPVIICTGHSSLIDEEKAKRLGIAGYVMKPASMSTIAKAIRNVLDK